VWFQDDWRIKPSLTLNLGLRYDRDFNLMVQEKFSTNATRMALEAIGHPFGAYPETPEDGLLATRWICVGPVRRRHARGSVVAMVSTSTSTTPRRQAGDITGQSARPLNSLATRTNTAIGAGELATFRFGIDPLPPQPTQGRPSGQQLDRPVDPSGL
jgi:hypothetical protein